MKIGRNYRHFYGCFIKTQKGGGLVLTRMLSCSRIGTRVFTPQNEMGVVYSKKSPQGGQVPLACGIGVGSADSRKIGVLKKKQKTRRKMK